MLREEYELRLSQLQSEYEKNKTALIEEYALSNNKYKIGDIIKDNEGQGEILSITPYSCFISGYIGVVYSCKNLTRKGEVNKRQSIRKIYQKYVKE